MCVFWHGYVKPKYNEKTKLVYVDTDSFIVYIKTDGIYKDIAEDETVEQTTTESKVQESYRRNER